MKVDLKMIGALAGVVLSVGAALAYVGLDTGKLATEYDIETHARVDAVGQNALKAMLAQLATRVCENDKADLDAKLAERRVQQNDLEIARKAALAAGLTTMAVDKSIMLRKDNLRSGERKLERLEVECPD